MWSTETSNVLPALSERVKRVLGVALNSISKDCTISWIKYLTYRSYNMS